MLVYVGMAAMIALAKEWPSGSGQWPVLIGSASELYRHNISGAVHLIHISLPFKFKDYVKRFLPTLQACKAYIDRKGVRPTSTIISEDRSMKRDTDFNLYMEHAFHRPNVRLVEDNSSMCDEQEGRHNAVICPNWLMLGDQCWFLLKHGRCSRRHEIKKSDLPSKQYSAKSQIKFRILECHSPIEYEINVTEFRTSQKHKWASQMDKLLENFESEYATQKRNLTTFHANGMGAVMHEGQMRRVKILDVNDESNQVRVRFVDIKGEKICQKEDIQFLMSKYRNTNDMSLIIGGLIPFRGFKQFLDLSTSKIKHMLKLDRIDDDVYFVSEVILHLNGLIIVKDIKMQSDMDGALRNKTPLRFKQRLIDVCAIENDHGLNCVMQSYERIVEEMESSEESITGKFGSNKFRHTYSTDSSDVTASRSEEHISIASSEQSPSFRLNSDGGDSDGVRQNRRTMGMLSDQDDSASGGKIANTETMAKKSEQAAAAVTENLSSEPEIPPTKPKRPTSIMERILALSKERSSKAKQDMTQLKPIIDSVSTKSHDSPTDSDDLSVSNHSKSSSSIAGTTLPTASVTESSILCEATSMQKNEQEHDKVSKSSVPTDECIEEISAGLESMRISVNSFLNNSIGSSNNSVNQCFTPERASRATTQHRADQIFSPKYPKGEQWRYATLKFDRFQKVRLSNFDRPSRFFVQNDSVGHCNERHDLYDKIEEFVASNREHLNLVDLKQVPDFCLAKFTDQLHHRGKIMKSTIDTKARVRCLDSGDLCTCSTNDIYELPAELLDFSEFQSIPCKLIGIKPKAGQWDEETLDELYDSIIDPCEYVFVQPVRAPPSRMDEFSCYSVVLVASTAGVLRNIADILVEKNYAEYDEGSKDLLKVDINAICREVGVSLDQNKDEEQCESVQHSSDDRADDELDSEENWDHINHESYHRQNAPKFNADDVASIDSDDFDFQFEPDQLKDLLKGFGMNLEEKPDEKCKNGPLRAIENDDNGGKNGDVQTIEKVVPQREYVPKMSVAKLTYLHKVPNTQWEQTPSQITLIVSAVDIDNDDYELNVTTRSVDLWFKKEQVVHRLLLNFFGGIAPEHTKHYIRGLNIIIKLRKVISCELWPRLTKTSDTHRNLTLRFDTMKNPIDESPDTLALDYTVDKDDSDSEPNDDGVENMIVMDDVL